MELEADLGVRTRDMLLCGVFWEGLSLVAAMCCAMAAQGHVKVSVYREVWGIAAHKTDTFEGKQGDSCLRKTIWGYHCTPAFKPLSHPLEEEKIVDCESYLSWLRQPWWAAHAQPQRRGSLQKILIFAKTGLRSWIIHEQKTRLHSSGNLYVNH